MVSLGQPQKAGEEGGRWGLVMSREHCQASSLTEGFMFSYFTGERSRVWEGGTGNIACD